MQIEVANSKFYYYICNRNQNPENPDYMEENFATRLKLFIETNGITPSQFADTCGIPRPSLSQVLSGRNKKISDGMIKQIHEAFPDVSVLWLMFGEGPVKIGSSLSHERGSMSNVDNISGPSPGTDSIGANFGPQNSTNPENGTNSDRRPILTGLGGVSNGDNLSKNQVFESDLKILDLQRQIENMRQNPRKVIQITIYYDDSTFETFIPK